MNGKEHDHFRQLLQSRQQELITQDKLAHDSQKAVMLDQQSVGRLSRMDALQQQAMAKATQTRRTQQSQRIDAALSRMKEGEFGYCVSCGQDIPLKRLELDPTTPLCISCATG